MRPLCWSEIYHIHYYTWILSHEKNEWSLFTHFKIFKQRLKVNYFLWFLNFFEPKYVYQKASFSLKIPKGIKGYLEANRNWEIILLIPGTMSFVQNNRYRLFPPSENNDVCFDVKNLMKMTMKLIKLHYCLFDFIF